MGFYHPGTTLAHFTYWHSFHFCEKTIDLPSIIFMDRLKGALE